MVPPAVPQYLQGLSRDHVVVHKKQKFAQDTDDDVWISELADEGHWTIVTIDFKILSQPHVASALESAGHTAIFLTKGWGNLSIEDLSWKYPKAWWLILSAVEKRIGRNSWYVLGPTSSKLKLHNVQPANQART